MAVPRPLILALMGVILLGATFLASATTRNATSEQAANVPVNAPPAQPASLSADQALKAALSGGTEVKSGQFDVQAAMKDVGGKGDSASASLKGTFQSGGTPAEVPSFDVDVKVDAEGQRITTGALSVGESAFLTRGDTAYRLPDAAWKNLSASRAKVAEFAKKGKAPSAAGILGVDTSKWLTKAKDEGTEQLDGVVTRHVSASINAESVVKSVLPLARQGGANVQLPPNFERTVTKVVKSAEIDAYVGTADRIPRRVSMAMDLDFRGLASNPSDEVNRVKVDLELNMTGVNKPQQIQAPTKVEPLRSLGREAAAISTTALGVGVVAFDPPPGMAQARQAGFRFDQPAAAASKRARSVRTPAAVKRAIKANRKLVIFFHNSRGSDDRLTARSVATLRRRSSVLVFTDAVSNVASYGQLLSDVGVSRTPSIVIIGKSGKARLVEGYIDPDALAQEVADAR